MNKKLLLIISFVLIITVNSCHKEIQSETTVYYNDFETGDLSNISNGIITRFNGSAVLGRYNKGYFVLTVNNLPRHSLVSVSFDLYIHDTWDGNKPAPDGPDIWEMFIDKNPYINATFSNNPCLKGNFCAPQSYPLNYPNNYNDPKTGAYNTNLPGVCAMKGVPGWTTQYKISKTITHSANTLVLQCMDKLVQTNTEDQLCDESWSVDNIKIQVISL